MNAQIKINTHNLYNLKFSLTRLELAKFICRGNNNKRSQTKLTFEIKCKILTCNQASLNYNRIFLRTILQF
ncbi:hypothetical protein HanPI659440_Chr16g0622691 [Helianthus annuus]|nr:hypothetical protein HanPI659440_Chr16g0622691 [Helianthus annuus]